MLSKLALGAIPIAYTHAIQCAQMNVRKILRIMGDQEETVTLNVLVLASPLQVLLEESEKYDCTS